MQDWDGGEMKKIYCASAYSGNILANIAHVLTHALALTRIAHPIIPHTSHPAAQDWDEAMKCCQYQLLCCDALLLLPGWDDSRGARQEKEWAEAVGMPVFYHLDEVKVWVNP